MSKHQQIDSCTLPVPIMHCTTGGLVPWAFAGNQIRPEARGQSYCDAVYCIDAPSFIPSGSFSYDGQTSYTERT